MNKFCLIFLILAQGAFARPPVNLIYQPKFKRKKKVLSERDIVFSDKIIEEDLVKSKLLKVAYSVRGRSIPGRKGKILFKIKKGTLVRFVKFSKSKRWVAVEIVDQLVKVWVPRSAVPSSKKYLNKKNKTK